ncbi:hypothetical protein FHR70_001097 [Microvirga lupini]|uniref:Uncharacterized protein n=1 Tax=Microvirga lupini TaxID=420324 RepID=A0A7W4VJ13_9HYPH|nr:hypothetical protein [Microvirga lupini]
MPDLAKLFRHLGADLLGQALGRFQLGKLILQRLVALAQGIVFRIGDRGRILLVIAPVMLRDLGAECFVLDPGFIGRQMIDGSLRGGVAWGHDRIGFEGA